MHAFRLRVDPSFHLHRNGRSLMGYQKFDLRRSLPPRVDATRSATIQLVKHRVFGKKPFVNNHSTRTFFARQRTRNLREKESLESVWRTFRVFSRAELFFYQRGFRGTQRLMFFGCTLRSGQERSRPQGDCYRFVAVHLWRMFPHRVPRVGRFCCAGFGYNNNFHSPKCILFRVRG